MLLTAEQKKRVCILARRVWAGMSDDGKRQYRNADGGQSETQAFELWRHAQQSAAVGRLSLSASENDEFCILMAHFALLGGDNKTAEYWLLRFASEERRRLFWLIKNSCTNGIEFPRYPDAIARAQYGCRLWQLGKRELLNMLSTVRNRANGRRNKNNNPLQMSLGI